MKRRKKNNRKIINRKYGFFEVVFELIVLAVLIKPMFVLGTFTGITYIIALIGSLITGIFFKKRKIARFIVIGTILCYLAGIIFKTAFDTYQEKNMVGFILILALAIFIWWKGFRLKRGK